MLVIFGGIGGPILLLPCSAFCCRPRYDLSRSVGKTFVEFKKGGGLERSQALAARSAKPAVEPEPVRPPRGRTSRHPSSKTLAERAADAPPPKV